MSKADWSWLKTDEVATAGIEEVTTTLEAGLQAVDERLGVEVSDDEGTRTVIVTAGGDADAFGLVRRLVEQAPRIPRWTFVALRPAGDFDFEIESGGRRFGVKALSFQPIEIPGTPGQLGVRLLVPNPQLEEWSETALQIIEVGLGEELAARIATIEIDERKPDAENVYPLESLPGYVARHTSG